MLAQDDEAFRKAMDDWRKYRQVRSRMRANAYARASYVRFRKTRFYRTTRILDGTSIIFSLVISVTVIILYYNRLFIQPETPPARRSKSYIPGLHHVPYGRDVLFRGFTDLS